MLRKGEVGARNCGRKSDSGGGEGGEKKRRSCWSYVDIFHFFIGSLAYFP
jgi:hypothetical protein